MPARSLTCIDCQTKVDLLITDRGNERIRLITY